MCNACILTAQFAGSRREWIRGTLGAVQDEGQGKNNLGLFLHDRNVSDKSREPLSCLAEAKL